MAHRPFITYFIVYLTIHKISTKQPHILLIVADDYGFHDIGYHNRDFQTPNLDKLALGGVRLENYYVQPICTPTRSQLLSGRYQLKEAGYSTHAVGKWHLGFYKDDYIPTNRGFDSFFGFLTGGETYYTHYLCYDNKCGTDMRDMTHPTDAYNGTYSTTLFAEKAIDVINNHDEDKPLFLYVPFQAVHAPMEVPEKYMEPYRHINDKFRRMVACMDEAVGNITEAMTKRGFWDDTVLVFTTDNGGEIAAGGNNYPLRGWKHSLWDGGMHAVGFVHSKLIGSQMTGSATMELMHVTDWFPTLVKLAKGNLNGTKPLDGFDQWATISWIPPPEYGLPVRDAHEQTTGLNAKNLWLFNIMKDPTEQHDMSETEPGIVTKMLDKLRDYQKSAVPCVYPKPDPRSDPAKLGGFWGPWE
ncbi:ARSJ-like protein [Mya arenaria]|uniref:ARSJ-like protein n=1 Tax=Mya arenaria TaxID=6604 RepID=A0ABY7G7I2_MYAAR|nr:ARSJ-like protein [Mya arenaria]